MKRLTPLLGVFLLAACGDGGSTEPAPSAANSTSISSSTPSLVDPGGEAVGGEIGKEAGFDCVGVGDCSVLFTVEDMEVLDACSGYVTGEQPADTRLVRIPVLIKTKPSDFEYNPEDFTIWSEWSALTEDGINQPLRASSWCFNDETEPLWNAPIRAGDTVRHVHYADVPIGTTKIRLTETTVGSRWTFPVPDLDNPTPAQAEAPATTPPAPARTPEHTPAAPAPAPAPAPPAPAPAPIIGFTGAPSVETPRVLDKTIASCGDPTMHETGTTFFTDGTSGWTQQCADQMGY